MKKLIIILAVLAALTYTVSFVAAQGEPTPGPGGIPTYVPGYSLGGVFYLFIMFAGLYLLLNILPNITRMLKGEDL